MKALTPSTVPEMKTWWTGGVETHSLAKKARMSGYPQCDGHVQT